MPISIIVVDDHTLSSEGLLKTLSTDGEVEVVGVFLHDAKSLEQAVSLSPDVIFLSYEMADMGPAVFVAEV